MWKWCLVLPVCFMATHAESSNDYYEVQKLHASDAAASDLFGASVAVSADHLLVGAPENDDYWGVTLVENMGAAYVFGKDENDVWVQDARLTPIDGAAGQLGTSVAIRGDTAFVGAPGERAVYIYVENSAGGWPHYEKILSPGASADDAFGAALAVFEDRLVVGAPGSGSVYFFEYDDEKASWLEVGDFTSPVADDQFGLAVAIDGDYVVVGAANDDSVAPLAGAAHVFAWTGVTWVYEALLGPPADLYASVEFGHGVAVSGTTALVSASRFDVGGGAGKAYLYDRIDGVWQPRAELLALDESPPGEFGWRVVLDGNAAIISDSYYDHAVLNDGAVYVFVPDESGDWQRFARLLASDAQTMDELGTGLALFGDTILAGAPYEDDGGFSAGAAYVFELDLGPEEGGEPLPATEGAGLLLFVASILVAAAFGLRRWRSQKT